MTGDHETVVMSARHSCVWLGGTSVVHSPGAEATHHCTNPSAFSSRREQMPTTRLPQSRPSPKRELELTDIHQSSGLCLF